MDTRPANAFLGFDTSECLNAISIIDWEFATIGPTFMDISNLIFELFFLGYTTHHDTAYVDVLDSFIIAYRAFGVSLRLKELTAYIGAAMVDLALRRIDRTKSHEAKSLSREYMDLALDFVFDSESTDFTLTKNDPFIKLSGVLRSRLQVKR